MANTLENGRAQFAFERVQEVAGKPYAKEYRSLARELPVMIQTNGFGTTISFLYAKKNNKGDTDNKKNRGSNDTKDAAKTKEPNSYDDMYMILAEWLKKQGLLKDDDELMEEITKLDRDGYKQMMREAMNFLHWVKRFAEGAISK